MKNGKVRGRRSGSGIKALISHSEIRLRWIFVVSLPILLNNDFVHHYSQYAKARILRFQA